LASTRTLDASIRDDAEAFIAWLRQQGVRVTVTSARRTRAQQAALYARWLAGRSRYPAAPPGTSKHEAGIAFDLGLDPPVYQQAGAVWEQYAGGTWGGRFRDEVHFERGAINVPKNKVATGFVGGSRGPEEKALEYQGTGPVDWFTGRWWTGLVVDPVLKALGL